MATTDFGSLSAARKKVWSNRIWIEGIDSMFWNATGMMGRGVEDATRPVHLVSELTSTERGDKCVMQLVNELEGDGVAGDSQLEGNEEALVNSEIELTIDQFRNGVKSQGRMSEQRTVIRFRAQARQKLQTWLSQRLDEMAFLTISGVAYTEHTDGRNRSAASQLPNLAFAADVTAPTSNRTIFQGAATSTATVQASETITWNFLVEVCAKMRRRNIKPIRDGGREKYCVVMSEEQARDLKQDSNYQSVVQNAGRRGPSNPLFNYSFADVDGLVLFSHNKVYNTLGATSGTDKWGAGSNVDGAQALAFGAQALGFARLGDPDYEESDNTDYGNKAGIAYGRIIGWKKPVYRSTNDLDSSGNPQTEDFGVFSVYTAAAA